MPRASLPLRARSATRADGPDYQHSPDQRRAAVQRVLVVVVVVPEVVDPPVELLVPLVVVGAAAVVVVPPVVVLDPLPVLPLPPELELEMGASGAL